MTHRAAQSGAEDSASDPHGNKLPISGDDPASRPLHPVRWPTRGGANYARGTGWYVHRFRVEADWTHRRISLQCDGANRIATVFLNGRKIGMHAGGFARFRFDLTAAIDFSGENVLAIRVNNAADGLVPVSADFTFFGGLYRAVQLFALDRVHVDVMDYAVDGVYVTLGQVAKTHADFSVVVAVRNETAHGKQAVIRTVVRDAQGAAVATQEETREIAVHGAVQCELKFSLDQPRLWNGRTDPYQYTADVTVLMDGQVRDRVQQRFGLRSFQVDADKGFSLNGAPLDLHDVSRHQDRAGKGWAISAEDKREDFAIIEEIGATALRVAHYPACGSNLSVGHA